MKKFITIILSIITALSVTLLTTACNKKQVIGIIQFGSHDSLNNCYDGIIKGLEESGINLDDYKVEYVNSNFDASVSKAQAEKMVNEGAKVIIAIATPSAIQAATAAATKNLPVVYCAVTDAKQVANFSNMTGTSDIPDFNAQLKLVSEFLGKKNVKIGILSSTEESSDAAQITAIKAAATNYDGMEIVVETIPDITTIDTHVQKLISAKVDCMVNLLDNTVVGKLQNILTITDNAKIPVFGSEIEQVKAGCLASASIEYVTVGKLCGKQAAEILNGKSVGEVKPLTMENETFNCYNSEVMKALNLTLPASLSDLLDVKA